jgi:hypothetical protein
MKTKGFTIAALALVALGVIVLLGMAPRLAWHDSTSMSVRDTGSRGHAIATVVKLGARAVVWMAQP